MNKIKYISYNSNIIPASNPFLSFDNRGIIKGDTFNFSCRGNSSKLFFFEEYYKYISNQFDKLNYQKPKLLKKELFKKDIELLLQKSRIYQGFIMHFVFYRNSLDSNSVDYYFWAESLNEQNFVLNQKGLLIDIFDTSIFPDILFNWFNTPIFSQEELIFNMIPENKYDNFLILNEQKIPFKAINSEVFFIKENMVYFSVGSRANANQILKQKIISIVKKMGFTVIEGNCNLSEILRMDEAYLINPNHGIQWVVGLKEKRYYNKIGGAILYHLNELAQNSL
jgi:branched-subunit amino acid aminotransferase/4-amino-4-deoxychorismate lyase